MSKKFVYLFCFSMILFAACSIEARCRHPRTSFNFAFVNPTPAPVVYYPAPAYYVAPVPVYHRPVVVYQPVQPVYYTQPTTSFSFGWTFR